MGVYAVETTTAVRSFIGFPMRQTLRIVPTVPISQTLRRLFVGNLSDRNPADSGERHEQITP